MYVTSISEVLGTKAIDSVKLDHVDNSRAIKAEETHNVLMEDIKKSTEKIQKETAWVKETQTAKPLTPEFIKHLDILY